MRKEPIPELVPREVLERIASILGPASASAMALADADAHDGPVNFWMCGKTVIVERLPKDAT